MKKLNLLTQGAVFLIMVMSAFSCSAGTTMDQGGTPANERVYSDSITAEAVSGVAVEYKILNDWGNGFTADVIINNNSGKAINGWKLTFTFPGNQSVTGFWRSKLTQSGKNVTVVNESYNALIPNGGSESFGFQAAYSGANAKPVNFVLNGVTAGSSSSIVTSAASSIKISSQSSAKSSSSAQTAVDYTLQGTDVAPNLVYNQIFNGPVYGAKVVVNMSRVGAAGVNKDNAIANNIGLFTLCHGGGINRPELSTQWTRWYQEYQNVQVFRLFTGEINTWNDRGEHPRVETYSKFTWTKGGWHEWNGTFHITKINGACIFQVFNNVNQWAMQLGFGGDGTLTLNHRRNNTDQIIGTGLLGKDFDIKIRDNGLNYECYLNGKLAGSGWYDRPSGNTQFRWGMYRSTAEVVDSILFVRGAHYQ